MKYLTFHCGNASTQIILVHSLVPELSISPYSAVQTFYQTWWREENPLLTASDKVIWLLIQQSLQLDGYVASYIQQGARITWL